MALVATTTTTDISNTIKTWFDKVLLETLDPLTRYMQFGEKKPVPRNEGTSVRWNMVRRFDLGRILTEGTTATLSAGRNLSTYAVSAIVSQYGDWVPISDVADYASIMDVGRAASERLAAQAAETLERVTQNAIIFNPSAAGFMSNHRFKTSLATSNTGPVTDYWGMISAVSAAAMTVSANALIAVSDIKDCVFELKRRSVPKYDGSDYLCVMSEEVAADLADDSDFKNFHQYVEKGVDDLYNGEFGKLYGARMIETPIGPAVRGSNSGGTASTIAYGTVIFGKGFYGVTEFDGSAVQTYLSEGASKSDPLDQTMVYGWKANFTAKVLNPSAGICLWSGSNDTTAAYAESANSGLRQEDPSDY